MAGNYMDYPGPRIPYDLDGSLVYYWNSYNNAQYRLTTAQMQGLNGEYSKDTWGASSLDYPGGSWPHASDYPYFGSGAPHGFTDLAVLFPIKRDIRAAFIFVAQPYITQAAMPSLYVSPDSTNGIDGTWTNVGQLIDSPHAKPYYRVSANVLQLPVSPSIQNIKAVRLTGVSYVFNSGSGNNYLTYGPNLALAHFYGAVSASATNDRVALWHPVDNTEVTEGNYFDEGDVPRSSTADKTFRIKNVGSRTANNVVLSVEALTDTTPSVANSYSIGDASSFASTKIIPSLAPGALSDVFTLRRTTPTDAQFSTWTARLDATVTSWS